MDKFFIVGWRGMPYEGKVKNYLIAPDLTSHADFAELCHSLVPVAGKNLLEKYGPERYPIGWLELTEEICRILVKDHGYTVFSPKKVEFKGDMIITDRFPAGESDKLLGDVRSDITHHNDTTIWDGYHQAVS